MEKTDEPERLVRYFAASGPDLTDPSTGPMEADLSRAAGQVDNRDD